MYLLLLHFGLREVFFPSPLNDSNICLIPKSAKPKSMKDLRPMVYKMVYKMVLKFLANILKKCSTFIEGCTILDNALIAIETIHALKRKTKGNKGKLALKIDISKACDRVDWSFLKGVLARMGFGERCS